MPTLLMDPHTLEACIGRHVDWARPELTALAGVYRTDPLGALVGLVRHLRARVTPTPGFAPEYVRQLRASAGEAARQHAKERIAAAFQQDLLMPYHHNAFMALGAETLQVGMDAETSRRLAAHVWEQRARWRDGYFGVAGSVGHLLRYLWPLEEVADADLLPLFGWLLEKTTVEWGEARAWAEPMLGTTGHNWWAHTFIGLWCAGFLFPEFTTLAPFRAFLPDYLERELAILFADDGWSKEGSPGYHEFAAADLLEGALLAARNGLVLPESVWARLRQIANTGWQMLAPDGEYPVFGDAVRSARYAGFGNQQRDDRSPLILQRRRAARFSLPEAKYVAEALDPDWQPGAMLPEYGTDLLPAYQRLRPCAPAAPDTCLPSSGFYIMRQDWTPQADWLGIEAGPLGSLITSHKHVSLFNFELYARGRRLLVDNWYGSVAEEREDDRVRMWRVSTAAHNTATIDGQDQVPIRGEFRYGAVVTPTVDDWRSAPAYAYFSGVHEGYRHLPEPVAAHRRKLFYLRGQYWILLDRFSPTNAAAHDYQLHFHLNAPAEMLAEGRVVTRGAGGNLLIVPVPGLDGIPALAPNPYPLDGYENPAHLTYTRRAAGNTLFASLLAPFTGEIPAITVTQAVVQADSRALDPWEVTGLQITFNGRDDVYLDHHLQWNLPWQVGAYAGTARLFHSACR